MKVYYVAPECKPFSKVGGLADVAGELPPALKKEGIDITIITPLYKTIYEEDSDLEKLGIKYKEKIDVMFENEERHVNILEGNLNNVPVLFLQNYQFLDEGPFVNSTDFPYSDDGKRFSFFSKAIVDMLSGKYGDDLDIVHANDWTAGYLFGFMDQRRLKQKKVLSIHNIGYQGNMWKDLIRNWEIMNLNEDPLLGSKFDDPRSNRNDVNPLKLALELADKVNAVSPNYAKEILQHENPNRYFEGGKGLEIICRNISEKGNLHGILNGFEYKSEPSDENFIEKLEDKKSAKKSLGNYFENPDSFLLGFVGRAVEQKFKLLTERIDGKTVLEHILDIDGVNIAILATGEENYERLIGNISLERFNQTSYDGLLGAKRRKNYASFNAFDKEMAGRINDASDALLMPSLYEPCGISQLEAMANATPPIVRWTGGLTDTVTEYTKEGGCGFGFDGKSKEKVLENLIKTVVEARDEFFDKESYQNIMKNAYFKRFLWEDSAKKYIEMYDSV